MMRLQRSVSWIVCRDILGEEEKDGGKNNKHLLILCRYNYRTDDMK